jgi:hypothetical protein
MLMMGAFMVRKLLVAPKSRMAQVLMEVMLMLTVRRREAAARAKLGGGVEQLCDKQGFNFLLKMTPAPNH